MNKIESAKSLLVGNTRCVIVAQKTFISEKRGIAPLIEALDSGEYNDCVAADIIVGKAAAMIYVKMCAKEIYARTISTAATELLDRYGIPYTYEHMTERIRNRQGDGMCPMERTVMDIDDPDIAVVALKDTLKKLQVKTS